MSRVVGQLIRRLLMLLVAFVPPILLAMAGYKALLRRIDVHLTRAQPIAVQVAQSMLGRTVTVQKIQVGDGGITLARLEEAFRKPELFAALPITVDGVTVGLKPEEAALANLIPNPPKLLGQARRITLTVSVPGLLGGKANTEGITQVDVERPDGLLVRLKDGTFPIQNILPRTAPPDYSKPPFQTLVRIKNGRGRFLDLAAKNGERVADNSVQDVNGYVDMLGTRQLRFAFSARARQGTPTARRLTGGATISGSASRGPAGVRPDAPTKESPRYVLEADASGLDAAYWLHYAMPLEGLDIQQGRADVHAVAVGPRGDKYEGPHPPPILQARARFAAANFTVTTMPDLPLQNWGGNVVFNDDRLDVDATGSVLGTPAALQGKLSSLRKDLGQEHPIVQATLDAPSIPVRQALRTVNVQLPKEITPPETITLSRMVIQGDLNSPQVSGRVALPRVTYKGFPSVENISALLTFTGGTAKLEDITGRVAGGSVKARAVTTVAKVGSDGKLKPIPPAERPLAFSGEIQGVSVRALEQVRNLKKPFTVEGKARATFVGQAKGADLQLWANATGEGVRVAGLPLRAVTGRVQANQYGAVVTGLHLLTDKGGVVGEGRMEKDGQLAVNFTASGVDAGWVASVLGFKGISGVVSGQAAVAGNLKKPTVVLRNVTGLNLRANIDDRKFAIDTARLDAATLSLATNTLTLDKPLLLRRFPAQATIRGQVKAIQSEDPQLALRVTVRDVELEEILQQAMPKTASSDQLAATIEGGEIRVNGTAKNPVIDGKAQVGQIQLATYPIESGTAEFRYEKGELFVKKANLLASIGELEGSLRLGADKKLTGRFEAPELNLEALSFLTESVASLAGKASATINLSGTSEKPIVVATVLPGSFAEVAGTHLTDLSASVRVEADIENKKFRLTSPAISFRQAGALVTLNDATFDPETKAFSAKASVADGQLAAVIDTLRRSRLDETEAGQALIDALNQIPAPVDGRFTLTTALSGRIEEGLLKDAVGSATLTGTEVTLGPASIKKLDAAATLNGREVTISKLDLIRDEATVDLPRPGKITLPANQGDPIAFDLTLDSPETNLDLVRAFLPRFPLLGKVGLTVRLTGDMKAPNITASLEGQNLAINMGGEREFPLSRVSFIANARRDASGNGVIEVDSGRVEHTVYDPQDRTKILREDAVSFDAAVPVETIKTDKGREIVRLAGGGALKVKLGVEKLGLDTLSEAFGGKVRASGTLTGEVSAGGTLRQPALGGQLALDASEVRLPKDAANGDVLNPITTAKLALALEGNTIRVSEGILALGAPSAKQAKESFGSVALTGSVRVDNLAELPSLVGDDANGAIARVAGEYDLTLKFNGLRPVGRNITALILPEVPLGLGEAVTGKLNGDIRITGKKLLAPVISSGNQPLQLTQALVLLPIREGPQASKAKAEPLFNPTFDIAIDVPTDATMANQSRIFFFDFKAQGEVRISGSAYSPEVRAELNPTGGRIRYPLAPPFRVKKQGSIQLVYDSRNPRLNVTDLEAEGTISVRPDSLSLASTRIRDSGTFLAPTMGASLETASRYKVTLAFNGPLDVFGPGAGDPSTSLQTSGLTATSDPPLPGGTQTILRILGADAQLRQLASGDTQGALLSTLEQVSSNVLISGLLDPFNKFISDAFGLSDFNINYFPDGTAIIQASVSLRPPLERFSVNMTRTVQTRANQTQRVPALLSLTYDIKSFGAKPGTKQRYIPRLQLGVGNDEQRIVRYFLRGTISY